MRVAEPPAGTCTRKRDSVDDSFSAGTLLSVIFHVPKCDSRTSTVAGSLFAVGFVAFRGGPFAPPFLAHVYTAVIGIVLLLRV